MGIWQAMREETLRGIPVSEVIGGGDPEAIAAMIVSSMDAMMPISPDGTVLDVGCGCGRIAAGLTGRLSSRGQYIGIDIVPGLIDFARRHITTAHPNFKFHVRNQRNSSYDYFIDKPGGIKTISSVVPRGTVDNAIATSLFTHLDFAEAAAILKEISRALKQSGELFMTCFIVDDAANPGAAFSFKHPSASGRAMIEKCEDPAYAVAMTAEQLKALLEASGLRIVKVNRGSWSGRVNSASFQDEIVAEPIATSSWLHRFFSRIALGRLSRVRR